ncbi:MAG: HDOD domain-containing protein [Ignavibacteriales bacterium]|nr:HDOD domain-containing protein [Ignavibacteriales bacterium]
MKSLEEKIIVSINNLPTLPTIYTTIAEAIEDPSTTNLKLANLISTDQASAFKILKVVNSPLYGFHGKIDSISQAIMYLGRNEVKNIIFALSVMSTFSKDRYIKGLRPVDLWAHSIGVGVISRNVGLEIGEKKIENYFLAGVLHDIGKIIFLEFVTQEYQKVVDLATLKNYKINEAENEILGLDHERAGKLLAEKWRIPQSLQDIILYHSNGKIGNSTNKLLSTVHLANIIAKIIGFGFAGDHIISRPEPMIWDELKLKEGAIKSMKNKFLDDYSHAIKTMLL